MSTIYHTIHDIHHDLHQIRADLTRAGIAHLHLTDQELYTTICQAYLVLESRRDDPSSWSAWCRAMETVERGEGA
jgi:hypothetical protein